jgi:hypothetical protein
MHQAVWNPIHSEANSRRSRDSGQRHGSDPASFPPVAASEKTEQIQQSEVNSGSNEFEKDPDSGHNMEPTKPILDLDDDGQLPISESDLLKGCSSDGSRSSETDLSNLQRLESEQDSEIRAVGVEMPLPNNRQSKEDSHRQSEECNSHQ